MDNIKRHIVIASHSTLAQGMANALKFFEGDNLKLTVLSAYVDNKPIEGQIEEIFDQFDKEDEVIVLTDLLGGSVNQKFFPYINRPHTHLITGMNLSLAMAITMEPVDGYLMPEKIQSIVSDAQSQVKYVNELANSADEDDEDE
ncbi:PTS sugar transporter subunit IIA [Lactobacillus johnsonii]|uniref:Phosphoenolpyruvate-dependent sugar phosphotransferase system EIIA, probable mannose specific n=1 Tax=Lactobacillus johnsonii (strain CNCM I-12250 / La1 / NCC 533) TaxID=257314 RepID=Q74KL0_LACJO|nr:PTS N-acetylglucosamine transporter subunit IIBC [Lactobacillus johnsonii]AAS08560.1 phosphoenolpyruvate-dependent sugar phosphotransferase system EIIA, probable mannose specific [Lactobacillus johnsonii NCC 533]MCT3320787.1 PTS N-acetylglucosamine transporter subunit IIBC [Lactobacillus johnsonii]MCT3339428.1 PTS N-acetylglucosamine transporter subunit IIBC [Lactobacillus johnsonii]MCT3389094.1 PTS N-acetylglucosamine transporter subunit IIBC [Lactobacillus johnsonii]UOC06835.1 PTS N-acety